MEELVEFINKEKQKKYLELFLNSKKRGYNIIYLY